MTSRPYQSQAFSADRHPVSRVRSVPRKNDRRIGRLGEVHSQDPRDADDECASVAAQLVQCLNKRHGTTVMIRALRHDVAIFGSAESSELDRQGFDLLVALPRGRGRHREVASPVIVVAEAVEHLPATLRIAQAGGPSISPIRSHESFDGLLLNVHGRSVGPRPPITGISGSCDPSVGRFCSGTHDTPFPAYGSAC